MSSDETVNKMDATLKAKWLKALRSGKYKQTKGVLRSRANHYCCLGVLCDVIDPDAWRDVRTVETDIKEMPVRKQARGWGDRDDATLEIPHELARKIGLRGQGDLATLNDAGKSFREIADFIEMNR